MPELAPSNFLGSCLPSELELEDQSLLPGMEDDVEANAGCELLLSPDELRSHYSGKIVDKCEARVQGILAARALGVPLRRIMRAFRVGASTVYQLEQRHGRKLETIKRQLVGKFGAFIELGMDRAINELDRMDIDKLMIQLGIASEKFLLMQGDATVITGSTDAPRKYSLESLHERLSMRAMINVTPTGLGGGNVAANAGAGAAAAVPALAAGATERPVAECVSAILDAGVVNQAKADNQSGGASFATCNT